MTLFSSIIQQRQMRQADSRNAKALAYDLAQRIQHQIETKDDAIVSDRFRHRALAVTDSGEGFPVSLRQDLGRCMRIERIVNDGIFQQLLRSGVNVISSQLAWSWYDPKQEESVIVIAHVWLKP